MSKVINTITLSNNPTMITSNGTYVWVSEPDNNSISKINIATGVVTQIFGFKPQAITHDMSYVWVVNNNNFSNNSISKIDILSDNILNTITDISFSSIYGNSKREFISTDENVITDWGCS